MADFCALATDAFTSPGFSGQLVRGAPMDVSRIVCNSAQWHVFVHGVGMSTAVCLCATSFNRQATSKIRAVCPFVPS